MITITTRTVGKCVVLDCKGNLTVGAGVEALHGAVRTAIKDGCTQIVLNLKEVEYTDSCGIGELVSSLTHVQSQGGRLILLNPHKYTERLLIITKLLPVFEIHKEEALAVGACR